MTNIVEKRQVGGNYFHLKLEDKIITSTIIRDCRNDVMNNCDYEVITYEKDGVIHSGPIRGENWLDEELFNKWIDDGHTTQTEDEFHYPSPLLEEIGVV